MEQYTRIACHKISELTQRHDFEKIVSITSDAVTLTFTGCSCQVSPFGRVSWTENN